MAGCIIQNIEDISATKRLATREDDQTPEGSLIYDVFNLLQAEFLLLIGANLQLLHLAALITHLAFQVTAICHFNRHLQGGQSKSSWQVARETSVEEFSCSV
jgi:hypothetical protein